MSTTTTNLGLILPADGDSADIQVLNEDLGKLDTWVEYDRQIADNVYAGRNIALIPEIADEVASYATVYAFLHARAQAANWKGLRIGDWFNVTLTNGTTMQYQIAAFDHYYNCADSAMGHHFFCVPTAPWSSAVVWNTSATNQGNSTEPNPYLISNLHSWELNTFYPLLPSALQSVLINHRSLCESRYSASGGLTASTGWTWKDLGKVFSLSEMEVYGCCVCGTMQWSQGMDSQLPLFRETKNRIKSRANWWLRVASGSSASGVCGVAGVGAAGYDSASHSLVRPLPCFLVS